MDGTSYDYGPDAFFYFLSHLVSISIYTRQWMGPLFSKRITEQFGTEEDALGLAMRIYAAVALDLCDSKDYERLVQMQEANGSWPMGWMYKYGASGILIGNTGLTMALTVLAIRCYKELECRLRPLIRSLPYPPVQLLLPSRLGVCSFFGCKLVQIKIHA
ncbi:hypothetical protein JVU11DRAFT_10527 [Chiua virens]|nr:hypothetical protein JVU11DRAFT_10527 [Chiua virens]